MAEIAPQKAWGIVSRSGNGRLFLWPSLIFSTKGEAQARANRFREEGARPVRVLVTMAEDVTLG